MASLRTSIRSVVSSWRVQSPSIRVIRLWLGVTWIYGGWDKATDPNFLSKVGSTSISKQLTGYSTSSPMGFIFKHMIERATLVGVFVMLAEFALGLATLLWIAPTAVAFAGFTMSLGLWIAATWHVKPYFLASDTAYAILWLSYLLALIGKRRKININLDRRGAIRVGGITVAAVLASLLGRGAQKNASSVAQSSGSTTTTGIVKVANLPIGQSYEFALADGQPAIVFRTKNGVFAYSEVCTHQGCTVSYSAADKALICPCHGATYDPFNGASVLGGPTGTPLAKIRVAISGDWVVQA